MSTTSVYRITNKVNKKVYFGKASDIKQRWYQHIWDAEHGKNFPLHRALRKYGVDVFSFEVLAEYPTNEEACHHEIQLIASVPQGLKYNVAEGGDGGLTMTPDQLEAQYVIKASQYDEFRKYFNQGWTIEQLGKHFGASYNAVKSCARRLELSFSSRRFQRTLRHLEQKAKKQEAKAADQERLQQLKAVKRRLKKQLEERPQAAHQLRQVYRDMASLTPRPGTKARRPPKMTATEYSAFRAEVARRSNKSRGLSEGLQQQALNLYFEEGLTAKQVADRLGTTKGSIRGAVNRAYDRMTPEEHSKLKTHHGSVVRTGARNSNYRGTL